MSEKNGGDAMVESEVRERVLELLRLWADRGPESTRRFLASVTPDFTGYGTGPGDYYADPNELRAMVVREHEGMSLPFSVDAERVTVRAAGERVAVAEGLIRVEIRTEEAALVEVPRFTFVLEKGPDDAWMLAHFHFSVPDLMQKEGDTMDDLLWTRNRELERLVDERTAELEAAHREARIEAALERVRARTAEMLRSEELADVAVALFRELERLGIAPRRCGFAVHQPDDGTWQFWHTTHEGRAIERAGTLTESQVPFFADAFAGWRTREAPSTTVAFEGPDLNRVIHLLLEQTEVALPDAEAEVRQGTYPERVHFNFFFFARGALLAHTLEPLSDADRAVLERFAGVFDLAYTRYEDFRRLEAKNREVEQTLARLRETQEQLVQREKLASLGQLTAGIAHEIKNPLNFVNNFAGLSRELVDDLERATDAEERDALLADLKTNAAKIEEHGRRADAIVRQMMEHARSGSGERASVDLNALVEEYAHHAYHGARARRPTFHVEMDLDLGADVGEVELVPPEIGRVLINLLDNAFDAVRERAESAGPAYRPAVRVATRRLDGAAEIRIADNGPGVPASVRPRIFEPFFTTRPAGQGTGLGLSLAYDIVTQGHRGALELVDTGGEGATFRLVLPAG